MGREEASKAVEVMKAYAEGKKIEGRVRSNTGWILLGDDVGFDWHNCDYRIAEEPVLVPWESEADVPWNCWVKRKDGSSGRWHVGSCGGVFSAGVAAPIGAISFQRLFDDFLWSTDGKTWSRCGKVE